MLPAGFRTRDASKGATGSLKSTMPLPTFVPVTAVRPCRVISYWLASGQPVGASWLASESQRQLAWYTYETSRREQSSCRM